jgi:hypothetical protein
MKRMAFAIGVLVLAFAAANPARADYSVVRFEPGYCRIWWDAAATPWGTNWTKVAHALDYQSAWAAREALVAQGVCR